jgi:prepilin-type N-terminal cleavage/methylation domain-containing protein
MILRPSSSRSSKAFTLIELLIVISIIALLIALSLPAITASRRLAIKVQCGSVMRQAGIGFGAYRTDYREWVIRLEYKTGSSATSGRRWYLDERLTYSQTLEDYWPPAARYCPSVAKPDNTTFEWAYTAPLLNNTYAAEKYMAGRATPPGSLIPNGYVKLVPGPAVITDVGVPSQWGSIYKNSSGKSFDPIYSQPLLADYLQSTNAAAPYRIAPHNGTDALSRTDKRIDSEGGHTLWEDYHVEWHLWPDAAKAANMFDPSSTYANTGIIQYPRDISSGTYPEGWTASDNGTPRYFFWCKQAIR